METEEALTALNSIDKVRRTGLLNTPADVITFIMKNRYAMAKAICSGHDNSWEGTSFDSEFEKFQHSIPKWIFDGTKHSAVSFLFHDKYKDHKYMKVLRHQRNGICGCHAAAVYLHYVMDIQSNGQHNIGSIDLTKSLDYSSLSGADLALAMYRAEDIAPTDFIERVSNISVDHFRNEQFGYPYSTNNYTLSRNSALGKEMLEVVATQPILVRGFTIEPNLIRGKMVSFGSEPVVPFNSPTHALVIVGGRYDTRTERFYFLCQNWHKEKQFIEVSGQYLASVRAQFSWLTDLHALRVTVEAEQPMLYFESTETCLDDSFASEQGMKDLEELVGKEAWIDV